MMLDEVHPPGFEWHNSLFREHFAYLRDAHAVAGTRGEVEPLVRPQRRSK